MARPKGSKNRPKSSDGLDIPIEVDGTLLPPEPAERKPRGRRRKVALAHTEAIVSVLNLGLSSLPLTRNDALDDTECKALAVSLRDLAMSNRFVGNIVLNLVNVQQSGEFPLVVGAIIAKRLARREKVPFMVGIAAEGVIEVVASRGASVTHRANGQRQDDVSAFPDESSPVLRNAGDETG